MKKVCLLDDFVVFCCFVDVVALVGLMWDDRVARFAREVGRGPVVAVVSTVAAGAAVVARSSSASFTAAAAALIAVAIAVVAVAAVSWSA